ncbi:MAG: S49 family peptidase, partial [candidate division WOR-3 bacterium]
VMKRGEHSDAFSPHRKLTAEEHQMLKKATQDFYHQFIQKVAKGRNKTYDYIDSIGQGRVWTGNQAKENGLVDTLGGLLAALDFAKQKAEAKEPKIIFLPKPKRDFLSPMLNWAWNRIFKFE